MALTRVLTATWPAAGNPPARTLDLRNGHEPACAQVMKQESNRGFSGQLRRFRSVFFDSGHIDVRNEVVRVAAFEDDDLNRLVGLGLLNERDQITRFTRVVSAIDVARAL